MPISFGRDILMKLKAAGIVPSTARRVILDIDDRQMLRVIYDCYGSDRWLEVDFDQLFREALNVNVSEPCPTDSATAGVPAS
jgi:hypothetical protein